MAAEYDINLSNGTVLATLYPLETNGPDNVSTPRKIQEARPAYRIVQAIAGPGGGSTSFKIAGDFTDVFQTGFQFNVAGPSSNTGTYSVASSSGVGSPPTETLIVVNEAISTSENDGGGISDIGSIIAHIFRLNSDLSYRFVSGFSFDVSNASETGSPAQEINGTYTVTALGSTYVSASDTTIIPVTHGSIRDNYIEAITPSYGNITYTVFDTNATVKLPGKGTMNYGEMLIENLVRMVEHFAADNPPDLNSVLGTSPAADPVVGQLWYNTTPGSEGFRHWDGSTWTTDVSVGEGSMIFVDLENDAGSPQNVAKVYLAGSETNLPAPWAGGSPASGNTALNLPGLVVWTDTDPASGEPLFRVLASDGSEALRVEHLGYIRTLNALEVQSTGDSYFYGRVGIGADGLPTLERTLTVEGNGIAVNADAGNDAILVLDSPSTNTSAVHFEDADILQGNIEVNGAGSPATLPLKINNLTSNDVVMVTGGGNVGVNTITPSHTLTVDGDILVPAVTGGSPATVMEVSQSDHWVGINTSVADATDIINDAMEVTGNLRANSQFFGSDQTQTDPTFSFTNDPDTGMFRSGTNEVSLTTGGVTRFTVEADGTLSVPSGYESNVTSNTDIPNKRYVDDVAGSGGSASWREPVRLRDATSYASDAAFPVNGIIDGVTLNDQDLVLFTNVTVQGDNDIWTYNAGSPSFWTKDVGGSPEFSFRTVGDVVSVQEGTYAGRAYIYDTSGLWTSFGSGAGINVRHESFISTGQTVFNLTEPYNVGSNRLFVYVDGVKQINSSVGSPAISDYTETDSTTVTFDTTVSAGAVVEFFIYDELIPNAVSKRETQTGLTGTPVITFTTITYAVGGDNLLVFLNGQKMIPGTDYTETTSDSITWVNPSLNASDVLEFYSTVPIVAGTRVRDIDDVSPSAPSNGDTLVYNSSTGLYESQTPPAGKPGYVEYPGETYAGSPLTLTYATPGTGGSNVNGGLANLQVFVNGVYQLENKNYIAGSSEITFVGSPPVPAEYDVVIYEFG